MSKYHKLKTREKQLQPPLEYKLFKLTALALLTFLVTLLATSACAPVQPTQAEELLVTAQTSGSSVSLETSGNVNLNLIAGPEGAIRTAEDVVYITSGTAGYQLYLSMQGDTNDLIQDGGSGSIPAGGGDFTAPATLDNNTWGFAVPQLNPATGSGSEDVIANNFDTEYPVGDNSTISSKFAKVPIKGDDLLIAKRSGAATKVPTNFYYAVRATSLLPSGLYKNTVVYTAIGDGSINNLASVSPTSTTQITGGFTLSIATPSTATLDSLGTITVTVGGETCQNPIATKNDALVNLTCTAPGLPTGWHDVVINFENTEETYVVSPGIEYQYNYTNTTPEILAITMIKNDTTTGALDLSDDLTMQQMTSSVCQAMKQSTATQNQNKYYILKDARDSKTYNVAKLDDGVCWMTSNLRLGSSSTITLTPENSDVSTNWDTPVVQTSGTGGWNIDAKHIYQISDANLYNWFTATAGTGTTSIINGVIASGSICPKNWKLPQSTNYMNLMNSAGWIINDLSSINKTRAMPYNFANIGNYFNGYTNAQNSHWWTSTTYENNALNLHIQIANNNDPHLYVGGDGKRYGFGVRCIFAN